jgi:HEAT repeat protein
MSRQQGSGITQALRALAADASKAVRWYTAECLVGREGERVTQALLVLAADRDAYVRLAAAWALSGREGERVTQALLVLAADTDHYVRLGAAEALAGHRPETLLSWAAGKPLHDSLEWPRERRELAEYVVTCYRSLQYELDTPIYRLYMLARFRYIMLFDRFRYRRQGL